MSQTRDAETDLGARDGEAPPDGADMGPLRDAGSLRDHLGERRHEGRECEGAEHEPRPHERRAVRQRPAGDQREPGGRSREGSPKIVDHLPHADGGDLRQRPPGEGTPRDDPGEQLPVSTRPPVLTGGGRLVACGELLEQLDVRHEPGASEDALEQVMAQECVLRDPARQGRLEGVDVVDALAGVRAFTEEILVDIGDGASVGIDPGRAGEDSLEERALAVGGHGRSDPGLKDAVPVDDAADPRVEVRAVERMRQGADEAAGPAAWQAGVGIERDDVPDGVGDGWRVPARRYEGRIRRAAEKTVQLVQLPALALPTHPPTLALVPRALPMEQEEPFAATRGATMLVVEAGDARYRCGEEAIVTRHRPRRRIVSVGEEREVEIAVRVGEVVDLQALDLFPDLGFARQERWHDHEGPQGWRHPVAELETGQRARTEHRHDGAVDNSDREV